MGMQSVFFLDVSSECLMEKPLKLHCIIHKKYVLTTCSSNSQVTWCAQNYSDPEQESCACFHFPLNAFGSHYWGIVIMVVRSSGWQLWKWYSLIRYIRFVLEYILVCATVAITILTDQCHLVFSQCSLYSVTGKFEQWDVFPVPQIFPCRFDTAVNDNV